MTKLLAVLALLVGTAPARAAGTISLGVGPAINTTDMHFKGRPGRSSRGPYASLRYVADKDDGFGLGVDLAYQSFSDRGRFFDAAGGQVGIAQLLVRQSGTGDVRPYIQGGAGAARFGVSGVPAVLVGSAALGLEAGKEGLVWGLELQATYFKTDAPPFLKKAAVVFSPSVRLGWRF